MNLTLPSAFGKIYPGNRPGMVQYWTFIVSGIRADLRLVKTVTPVTL